ncbi:MAG: glutathione S-transferase family protein [Rhodospirillales bacterium]
MKLYLNTASPYARLARVAVLEAGLAPQTTFVTVDPWASPPELLAINPAAKIPALELADGSVLIESDCIAAHVSALAKGCGLRPVDPTDVRRLAQLGHARALMDCAFGATVERRFVPESPLAARWAGALPKLLAALEKLAPEPSQDQTPDDVPNYAEAVLMVALDYLTFRHGALDWAGQSPRLSAWAAVIGAREAFRMTKPRD